MWGGNGQKWTHKDRLLVQALHLYEVSLCPCGCGFPSRESQNPRLEGWFSVETTVCHARAALEQHDDDTTTKKRARGELRWANRDTAWGEIP